MTTYYINEQNISDDATEEQARELIDELRKAGFEVRYGDSLLTTAERGAYYPDEFDVAFEKALEKMSCSCIKRNQYWRIGRVS